jgi:hypothetical protein
MNNSVGLIFFLDFVYSTNMGAGGTMSVHAGNTADESIYGGNKVAKGLVDGLSLIGDTYKQDQSGPRTTVGYAYGSPTGSNDGVLDQSAGHYAVKAAFSLNGNVSEANKKLIDFDPDLLATTSTLGIVVVDVNTAEIANASGTDAMDFDNMGAFVFNNTALTQLQAGCDALSGRTAGTDLFQVRRLSQAVSASESATSAAAVRIILSAATAGVTAGDTSKHGSNGDIAAGDISFPLKDDLGASTAAGSIIHSELGLEAEAGIPEIDIKIDSVEVRAQTKKLKAKWTQELGQDLSAWHNVDAEVELTSVLAEHVALEIDREILADLIRGATAKTMYWSRSPGLFVNRDTGAEIGATAASPDFTGTVSEWYQTLIETINDVSANIHRKTLRGGANFVVCSPEVANILEFTSAFRASVTADAESGYLGVEKIGALNRKMDVIVDPYFPRQLVLVGRRGKAFLESGYVYAPYVPLQTFPTIPDPEDFTPRMGVMTRYAKKMIRPDMYGLVVVRGLAGESGS